MCSEPHEAEKQLRLDRLLKQQPLLWKAGECSAQYQKNRHSSLDTGFPELNSLLEAGGWPRTGLIEIQVDEWGQGELQLLLPLMARLSQQQQQIAWIAPPYTPYAPALHAAGVNLDYLLIIEQSDPGDIAWAAEKCLHHAAAAMVLFCLPQADAKYIRRLQVAAESGGSIGVLLHCGPVRQTPVPLRLKTRYLKPGLCVEILKSRFGPEQGRKLILAHRLLSREIKSTARYERYGPE